VAPPRVWKPRGAPAAASHLEPVWISPFGRAPAGAALGAALEALPNRPLVFKSSIEQYKSTYSYTRTFNARQESNILCFL
jgi:hypothetical protein